MSVRGPLSCVLLVLAACHWEPPATPSIVREEPGPAAVALVPLRHAQKIVLRSINYPDRYLRHRGFRGELTPVTSLRDREDATFRVVQGLADPQQVSFESTNYPHYYLRDEGGRLTLAERVADRQFDQDATFRPHGGLANLGGLSFESVSRPGAFIRHRGFSLHVEPGSDDLFRNDATFQSLDSEEPALPLAAAPQALSGVQVVRATYGRLCGVRGGNQTSVVAAECQGQERCDYLVNNRHGDPTPNCAKDFSVEWRCGDDPTLFHRAAGAVAGEGYRVSLACDESRGSAERVLLHDEFSGPELDASKWWVNASIPQGNAGVVIVDGQAVLRNRAFLNTASSFDPQDLGGIRITGEWTFHDSGDFLQVITRSDGTPGGEYGETKEGIEFAAYLAWGPFSQQMKINGLGGASVDGGSPAAIAMRPGETFLFEIVDAPPQLRFTLTKKGDALQTATVAASSSFRSALSRITLHNREFQGSSRLANLDDILVTALPGERAALAR